MNLIVILAIAIILIFILIRFLKYGFSFASFGGMSSSFSNGILTVNGNILSVIYQGKVIYGDPSIDGSSGNSISQYSPGYQFTIRSGHVVASGNIQGITLNGKKII